MIGVESNERVQILIIDDEDDVLRFVKRELHSDAVEVLAAVSWEEAKGLLRKPDVHPQVILVEPCFKSGGGRQSLREICAEARRIPVVVLSVSRDPENIAEAFQGGARHYLFKPVETKQLIRVLFDVIHREEEPLPSASRSSGKEVDLIFSSAAMKRVYQTAVQIADIKVPVLIEGESGVGKDLVARLIHEKSILRGKPFVKVNCAAMPSELVESELFGYRKGAFTGAYVDRPGKFEFAKGGTIFLDEIGEFPPSAQAKLLQVLQDGTFTRLGSNRESGVHVRVIVATNRNLEKAMRNGSFREDLYYRLNVVRIEIPPLRQRREEIPLLCNHFMEKFKAQYPGGAARLPERLQELFNRYSWPGNVRALENMIKRYIVLQDADSIQAELESKTAKRQLEEVSELTENYLQQNGDELDLKEIGKKAAAIAERNMITQTLRKTNWNKWKAAKELKVSYKTLLTKIEQYCLEPFR